MRPSALVAFRRARVPPGPQRDPPRARLFPHELRSRGQVLGVVTIRGAPAYEARWPSRGAGCPDTPGGPTITIRSDQQERVSGLARQATGHTGASVKTTARRHTSSSAVVREVRWRRSSPSTWRYISGSQASGKTTDGSAGAAGDGAASGARAAAASRMCAAAAGSAASLSAVSAWARSVCAACRADSSAVVLRASCRRRARARCSASEPITSPSRCS